MVTGTVVSSNVLSYLHLLLCYNSSLAPPPISTKYIFPRVRRWRKLSLLKTMPEVKNIVILRNFSLKTRMAKNCSYDVSTSTQFSINSVSIHWLYLHNSSVEKNISSWRLYLLLADRINMTIIEVVPPVTPMLHKKQWRSNTCCETI